MRPRWIVWSVVTAPLSAYLLAGYVSPISVTKALTLAPGSSLDLTLFRIVGSPLRAMLDFVDTQPRRPEHGVWATAKDWRRHGLLRFARPGAPVRITVTPEGVDPVPLEAMPASAHGSGTSIRELTSDLSVEVGAWRWPPADPRPEIPAGFTRVRFEVVAVDDRLNGEKVDLIVQAPLGFKSCRDEICWLWWWHLWPIAIAVQAGWAVVLVSVDRRARARTHRPDELVAATPLRPSGGEGDA